MAFFVKMVSSTYFSTLTISLCMYCPPIRISQRALGRYQLGLDTLQIANTVVKMVLVKAIVLLFPLLFQVQFKHNIPKTRPSQGNEIDAKHALDKRIGSSPWKDPEWKNSSGKCGSFPKRLPKLQRHDPTSPQTGSSVEPPRWLAERSHKNIRGSTRDRRVLLTEEEECQETWKKDHRYELCRHGN